MIVIPRGAHIHLIAVCGTAMGSLAGMLRESGYRVTGSDARVYPPMSDFLRSAGIEVMEGFDAAHLRPKPDLVVVGNAVSRGNVEVEDTLDQRLPFASLPEVLRDFLPAANGPHCRYRYPWQDHDYCHDRPPVEPGRPGSVLPDRGNHA